MTSEFFLWCAGTSRQLLDQSLEDDRIRQEQLGAHVFFTALLAFASSYFALAYVFDQTWSILIFSTLWCISIFLLDRTLIVSPVLMYKTSAVGRAGGANNDRLVTAWGTLIIRLVLAVLLGIFIATPFELKIFAPEIEEAILSGYKQDQINNIGVSIKLSEARKKSISEDSQRSLDFLSQASVEETSIQKDIESLRQSIKEKETQREREISEGTGGAPPGYGRRADQFTKELKDLYENLRSQQNKLEGLAKERATKNSSILERRKSELQKIDEELARLERNKNRLTSDENLGSAQEREVRLQQLLDQRQEKNHELDTFATLDATRLEKLNKELASIDHEIQAFYAGKVTNVLGLDPNTFSLLKRIEALTKLQSDNERILVACWVIFLVFMLFEVIPILAKFFFKGSAYDFLILREKRLAEAGAGEALADAIEREEQAKWKTGAARTQTEMLRKRNEAALKSTLPNDVLDAMKKQSDDVIRTWQASELRKHNRDGDIDYLEESFIRLFRDVIPKRVDSATQDSIKEQPTDKKPTVTLLDYIKRLFGVNHDDVMKENRKLIFLIGAFPIVTTLTPPVNTTLAYGCLVCGLTMLAFFLTTRNKVVSS